MKKINNDIRAANTLTGKYYNSNLFFKKTIDKIFCTNWLLVTNKSNLKNNSDVYPFNYLENVIAEPLLLVNNNNSIKCFSNVCTHRGNILVNKACQIKRNITCSYHGKQFDLNGKFISMPKCEGMKNFPSIEDDLDEIQVKQWKGFIFSSLNPKIIFDELFEDIEKRIGWMPIEKFKYRNDLSKEYIFNANWALYCDNYLEGFHIPFVHSDLNAVLDFENYDVEIFKYSNLQIGVASDNDICFDLPKESPDYGKKIAAYYFWVFPNMMFNFYPWGLSLNIVIPITKTKTKVIFQSYIWDEEKLNIGAGANLDKVEKEDEEIVEKVQLGTASRFYKSGRFSPLMEKGVHHFHSLITEFINM